MSILNQIVSAQPFLHTAVQPVQTAFPGVSGISPAPDPALVNPQAAKKSGGGSGLFGDWLSRRGIDSTALTQAGVPPNLVASIGSMARPDARQALQTQGISMGDIRQAGRAGRSNMDDMYTGIGATPSGALVNPAATQQGGGGLMSSIAQAFGSAAGGLDPAKLLSMFAGMPGAGM